MEPERRRILVADDDEDFLGRLSSLLRKHYEVTGAHNREQTLDLLGRESFDVLLLDLDLGRPTDGFDILDRIHQMDLELPVIMVTQDGSADSAVTAIKKGAADYIGKSPNLDELEIRIERAFREKRLIAQNRFLRREHETASAGLVGDSAAMRCLRLEIERASRGQSPALIVGETGSGKEMVARELHRLCHPHGLFVGMNASAIPRDLFERELFGCERGAYTGADRSMPGAFEAAQGGTIFLDEIAEVDLSLQARLLRVVEAREFTPLGGHRVHKFAGRVVASTNRDPEEAVKNGQLREDLYYRFRTFVLRVPALRERRDDIPALTEHLLKRYAHQLGRPVPEINSEMLHFFCRQTWPGNVRELASACERWVVLGAGARPEELIFRSTSDAWIRPDLPYAQARNAVVERFHREYMAGVLAACRQDPSAAICHMQISRYWFQQIQKKLKQKDPGETGGMAEQDPLP